MQTSRKASLSVYECQRWPLAFKKIYSDNTQKKTSQKQTYCKKKNQYNNN